MKTVQLGLADYAPVFEAMKAFNDTRNEATEDVQSGCDILAATLGRDTSAYVDIWKQRKRHLYVQASWELHLERLLVGD